MKQVIQISAAVFLFLAFTHPVNAQNPPVAQTETDEASPLQERADQVVAFINGQTEHEELFTDAFLRAVTPQQLRTITNQLTSEFGAAVSVESLDPSSANHAALSIRMERAIAKGGIAIDPASENRVSELLFQSFVPLDDSIEKIETDLRGLNGTVTWWYGPVDGTTPPAASSGSSSQMPIGSTFKLYVLATLAREVAEGKRAWSDSVTLRELRSFPSGMMQDWPKAAPVTLHTLASLMISISDNTATDVLIDELGREAVLETMIETGHSAPELSAPFLKTREMFLLKAGPEGRLNAYLRGDEEVKRQILDGIEDIALPNGRVEAAFSGAPIALDVEWFASANDIVNLMRYMLTTADPEAFEIMAINPSMSADIKAKWAYAGYKGGSEPGTLNLSWLLQDTSGRAHALILSWRDDDLRFDPSALDLIAQRFLRITP